MVLLYESFVQMTRRPMPIEIALGLLTVGAVLCGLAWWGLG